MCRNRPSDIIDDFGKTSLDACVVAFAIWYFPDLSLIEVVIALILSALFIAVCELLLYVFAKRVLG